MSLPAEAATAILARLNSTNPAEDARLLPLVYDELRALASYYFKAQPADHTLQPTALVHEVYLRLNAEHGGRWTDRAHFMSMAAGAMRQILIDYARQRKAVKRGGGQWQRVTLDDALQGGGADPSDVLALSDALQRLEALSPRQARAVELRVFGGLTIEEAARVLGVGPTTFKSDWLIAKAWLKRELSAQEPS